MDVVQANRIPAPFIWGLLGSGLAILLFKISRVGMRPRGYPPGPPTLPLIGNLHQFPRKDIHIQLQRWTEKYGPIVSLKLGTQTLILLGSGTAVSDLLEKKSSIYSTRMDMMFREWNQVNIFFRPYDNVWKRQRKVYHVRLNAKLANKYLPYQSFETYQLLYDLLISPLKYRHHLERFTLSIGSTIAFGRRVPSFEDPVAKALSEWFRRTVLAGSGLQIADWFPILRPIIRAVPYGINPIKRMLTDLHDMEATLWSSLVDLTREHVKNGRFYPSLCRDMIMRSGESDKDRLTEEEIWYNSGHAWAAATDTQSNTLVSFIKAMVLYPKAQAKARNEVDEIVGPARLPDWEDRPNMPYVRRCVEETLRWAPTTLTGGPMPHAASLEGSYMGYTIPAGAGIMNCVWTINNDPKMFENPREFNPLRYSEEDSAVEGFSVTQNYDKRPHSTFGAGRRICPGSYVAERTLFVTMARLLWAFEFHRKLDPFGNLVPIERDAMENGLVAGPQPFECDIRPRGEVKAGIIRELYKKAKMDLDTEGNYTEEFFKEHWTAAEPK